MTFIHSWVWRNKMQKILENLNCWPTILNETIKKNTKAENIWLKEKLEELLDAGYSHAGSGSFGTVLVARGKDLPAVKIGCDVEDGWPHYISWSRKVDNIHVPRVYSLRISPHFYYAEMEVLKNIKYLSVEHVEFANNVLHALKYSDDFPKCESLKDFGNMIRKAFEKNGYTFDFRLPNIMKRGNEVVVTDPIGFSKFIPFSKLESF